eukprot:gene17656-biopygen15925
MANGVRWSPEEQHRCMPTLARRREGSATLPSHARGGGLVIRWLGEGQGHQPIHSAPQHGRSLAATAPKPVPLTV